MLRIILTIVGGFLLAGIPMLIFQFALPVDAEFPEIFGAISFPIALVVSFVFITKKSTKCQKCKKTIVFNKFKKIPDDVCLQCYEVR